MTGIFGIIALAFAQSMQTNFEMVFYVEDRITASNSSNLSKNILVDPTSCLGSLNPGGSKQLPNIGANEDNFLNDIVSLMSATPITIASVGDSLSPRMSIDRFSLSVDSLISDDGTNSVLACALNMHFIRPGSTRSENIQSIPVYVEIDNGSRVIQNCSSDASNLLAPPVAAGQFCGVAFQFSGDRFYVPCQGYDLSTENEITSAERDAFMGNQGECPPGFMHTFTGADENYLTTCVKQ